MPYSCSRTPITKVTSSRVEPLIPDWPSPTEATSEERLTDLHETTDCEHSATQKRCHLASSPRPRHNWSGKRTSFYPQSTAGEPPPASTSCNFNSLLHSLKWATVAPHSWWFSLCCQRPPFAQDLQKNSILFGYLPSLQFCYQPMIHQGGLPPEHIRSALHSKIICYIRGYNIRPMAGRVDIWATKPTITSHKGIKTAVKNYVFVDWFWATKKGSRRSTIPLPATERNGNSLTLHVGSNVRLSQSPGSTSGLTISGSKCLSSAASSPSREAHRSVLPTRHNIGHLDWSGKEMNTLKHHTLHDGSQQLLYLKPTLRVKFLFFSFPFLFSVFCFFSCASGDTFGLVSYSCTQKFYNPV